MTLTHEMVNHACQLDLFKRCLEGLPCIPVGTSMMSFWSLDTEGTDLKNGLIIDRFKSFVKL